MQERGQRTRSLKRLVSLWLGVVLVVMGGPQLAFADAVPFFAKTGSAPDVLFVLDASTTMKSQMRDRNGSALGVTRAEKTVELLKKVVDSYSQYGVRFGLVRTSTNTPAIPLSTCKVGTSLVTVAANNAAAMKTGLDTYYSNLSASIFGVKDFEGGLTTAKSVLSTALSGDVCKSDRKRVVVFITGGGGSLKDGCVDDAATTVGQIFALPASYGATTDIRTFVMGFNLEDDGVASLAYSRLAAMALAGGTTEPRSARDEKDFLIIMNAIMTSLMDGEYTATSPVLSVNDEDLFQTAFRIYPTETYPEFLAWEGHISDFILDADGDITVQRWDTANYLNLRSYSSRKVYSSYDDGSNPFAKTAFSTSNVLQYTTMLNVGTDDINNSGDVATNDSDDTSALIKFVLGDTAQTYYVGYNRESYRLLDIAFSSPTYIPPPIFPRLDADYVSNFQAVQKERPDWVVMGSNGGMIHGVKAASWTPGGTRIASPNGEEAWSYVPRHVLPKLKELWRWDAHPVLQDATGRYSDVKACASSACSDSTKRWLTAYVQGDGILGDQATCKAYIEGTKPETSSWNCGWFNALEVSAIESSEYTFQPLWEFMGDGDIGYATSEPAFGRIRVKLGLNNELRDVVWVAGQGTTVSFGSVTACRSPIYTIDAGLGTMIPGSKVTLLYKSGSCVEDSNRGVRAHILPVDTNNDLLVDRLYVGDMQGQMWRVNLSSVNPTDWKNNVQQLVFNSSNVLPLHYGPTATYTSNGDVLVYFGTGSPETLSDYGSPSPAGGFYVILDNRTVSSSSYRLFNQTGEFSFPTFSSGEVMAGEPVLVGGIVYFTTYTASPASCRFGNARIYGLDYKTGTAGLDSNNDGVLDTKYIDLGQGIPSGVVVGKNKWYVSINDGGGNTSPGPGSAVGNLSTSGTVSSVVPMQTYSWIELLGH